MQTIIATTFEKHTQIKTEHKSYTNTFHSTVYAYLHVPVWETDCNACPFNYSKQQNFN